ncbi:MAG: hypothetical protein WD939_07840, partial [Dehalococcoidia bacterium]
MLLFFALLSFVIYGAVQGQEEPGEIPAPRGTDPLEGFGPEDLPLTPMLSYEVEGRNLLTEVTVDCASANPRLVIRARESLPAGATIEIRPMTEAVLNADGITSRWSSVGDPQLVSLSQAASIVETDLSGPVLAPAEFAILSVFVRFAQ